MIKDEFVSVIYDNGKGLEVYSLSYFQENYPNIPIISLSEFLGKEEK